jgi:hypothetical protein
MNSTQAAAPRDAWTGRPRTVALIVGACCVASLLFKLALNAERTAVAHGDTAYYYNLANSLVSGRGFTLDYVPMYFNRPSGIPCPANTWWMPMASLLGAAGMLIGGASYSAGQTAVIALTSLAPLLVYLLGRDVLASRAAGLLGAVLAVFLFQYLDHASVLNSPGPYLVFCSLALWLIARAAADPRWVPWAGAGIALVQLSRSDGILLWGALLLVLWLARRPWPWTKLFGALAAYLFVLTPLLVSNWQSMGTPLPSYHKYSVLMANYAQLYSLPENVTLDSFLAQGWDVIVRERLRAAAVNTRSFLGFLTHGPGPVREGEFLSSWIEGLGPPEYSWRNGGILVLGCASWCGLLWCRGRAAAAFWIHALLLWLLYSFAFAYTGIASMRVSMIGLSGVLLAAAARALVWLSERPWRTARTDSRSVLGRCLALGVPAALVVYAATSHACLGAEQIAAKSNGVQAAREYHIWVMNTLIRPYGLENHALLARDVHELHANTGLRLYSLPVSSPTEVLQIAARYQVRFALLDYDPSNPPGLVSGTQPGFEPGPSADNHGRRVMLVRLHPELLSTP